MSENKALWQRAFTTDPRAVKPITGKQYNGNSPKPYWIVERLTDEFGPCGIGWGFNIVSERYERFGDSESLHIAVVRLWYMLDGKRGELEQVGQTRGSYTTAAKDGKPGRFLVDEDAPKKSVTDALVKCASYLGFAGDIFSGMWDDSKYVAWAGDEWDRRYQEANTPQETAAEKAARETAEARTAELQELAIYLIDCQQQDKQMEAIRLWYAADTWAADSSAANDEKVFVWGLLKHESKLRSAIKANAPKKESAAA